MNAWGSSCSSVVQYGWEEGERSHHDILSFDADDIDKHPNCTCFLLGFGQHAVGLNLIFWVFSRLIDTSSLHTLLASLCESHLTCKEDSGCPEMSIMLLRFGFSPDRDSTNAPAMLSYHHSYISAMPFKTTCQTSSRVSHHSSGTEWQEERTCASGFPTALSCPDTKLSKVTHSHLPRHTSSFHAPLHMFDLQR